jgi:hypothetical protein
MTIEKLRKKLESITGDTPVDIARRLAIMALINQMMGDGE